MTPQNMNTGYISLVESKLYPITDSNSPAANCLLLEFKFLLVNIGPPPPQVPPPDEPLFASSSLCRLSNLLHYTSVFAT